MTKQVVGKVIKKSGVNTISVQVNRLVKHALYGKQMTKSKKLLVHDPENLGIVGESIIISPSRPISKSKHYVVFNSKKKETV